MTYKYIFRVVALVMIVSMVSFGQSKRHATPQQVIDKTPFAGSASMVLSPDTSGITLPLQFNYTIDATNPLALGAVGACFMNGQFISNRWNGAIMYHLSQGPGGGPAAVTDSVTTVSAIRDMTSDGTALYGAPASTTLYKIDPATGATLGTITLAGGTGSRAIAYDPNRNGFWASNWSDDINLFDATTGALKATIPATTIAASRYGMGWDSADGTAYLYAWCQTSTTTNSLVQINIQTGAVTNTYTATLPAASVGIAGGAEVVKNVITGTRTAILHYQGLALAGHNLGSTVAPVGPGFPTNPSPSGSSVAITGVSLGWVNPATATSIKVYYSSDVDAVTNMTAAALKYSGAPVTSWSVPGTLAYSTNYYFRVVEANAAGTNVGSVWSFKTMRDPSTFVEDFTNGLSAWTVTNDGGTCVWIAGVATDYTMPAASTGGVAAADADACGSGSTVMTTMTLTNGLNNSAFSDAKLEFDQDWRTYATTDKAYVDVSGDGGTTWTTVVTQEGVSARTTHITQDISAVAGAKENVKVRFRSQQPGWDWWWAVDNVTMYGTVPTPVELTSFAANTNGNNVTLNWATATETNNKGFEVERKSATGSYVQIGSVSGHGTTTLKNSYSFNDNNIAVGTYTYRLRQVDFDGTFAYSNEVKVDVSAPTQFSLDQNYPNPFNPTTKIKFSVASDAKVTLKVFNTIGEEVATLLNGNVGSGEHFVNFDASKLNSGVYVYRLDAAGVDGKAFTSIKKMVLMK